MWMLAIFPIFIAFLVIGFILRIFGPALSQWAKDTWDEHRTLMREMLTIWKDKE